MDVIFFLLKLALPAQTRVGSVAFSKPKDVAILELDKIAEKYSLDSANFLKGEKRKVEKPVLIISESFM